jgi:DNA-binding NtrC family response regulator
MLKKVLILDDEQALALSIQALFEARYIAQIDLAHTIKEARVLLLSNTYHALLVDNYLPDGTGYKLICDLDESCPWLMDSVMLFLSGVYYVDMMPEFVKSLEKFPHVHVRNKPVNAASLYEIMDGCLPLKEKA